MSNYNAFLKRVEPWLRELFDERAAIRQYDGGQTREQAERGAVGDVSERLDSGKSSA